jgi:hypothetical protein
MKPGRRRPSPALIVAIIALIVALGGTGYAQVVRITSSSQIKNGVIRGADVRKGTLTLSKLSTGTQRIIRRRGSGGGDVTAMEAFRKAGPEGQPANVTVKVATLKGVPAGTYLVTAKTIMTPSVGETNLLEGLFDAQDQAGGHCKIDTKDDVDESRAPIIVAGRQSPAMLYMQITRSIGATTDFDLLCDANAPWRTSDTTIVATKLDGSTRQDASSG